MNIAIKTSSGLVATGGNSLIATATPNATGKTTAEAPVLLALQSEETMDALGLANAIQALAPSLTVAEARYIVNAVEETLIGIVQNATNPVSIQLGFATFMWEVAGSLDSADGEANPITNYAFMTGLVPERYRKVFASFDTYVPTADQPCVLKRIRDKATNVNAIMGNTPFYLEGSRGMTYGGTGEKCELWDELMLTKKCDLTVTNHDSPILWECKIPTGANVPVGRYAIKVTTLAGGPSAGGTLYTANLDVNVGQAAVQLPKVTITDGSYDGSMVSFNIENAEAVRGYAVDETEVKTFKVDLWKNGTLAEADAEATWAPDSAPFVSKADFAETGDTVKIVAHVNPAKTGYDQSDAVHQFTVS